MNTDSLNFYILTSFFLGSALISLILGRLIVPRLGRLGLRQQVREEGPKTHQVKNGTPTMGALLFIPALVLCAVLGFFWKSLEVRDWTVFLLAFLACALLGFLDDYVKVKIKKEGLSVLQKTGGLLLICILLVLYLLLGRGDVLLYLPFSAKPCLVQGLWKLFYGLFLLIYFYFCINAVNLTDGVDGLAGSLTCINCFFPVFLAAVFPVSLTVRAFCLITAGCCFAFLAFNFHPARVFMGDTGSLSLGLVVALWPVLLGMPWLMLFTGFVYIVEALSVVIQVLYFKKTGGKRIFRMTPIHHHFELGGWKENKIVWRLNLVNLITFLIGLVLLLTMKQ